MHNTLPIKPKGVRSGEIHRCACEICGASFGSLRRGTRFCSDRCRQASSRSKRQAEKQYEEILILLGRLAAHDAADKYLPLIHGWMHDNQIPVKQIVNRPWDFINEFWSEKPDVN